MSPISPFSSELPMTDWIMPAGFRGPPIQSGAMPWAKASHTIRPARPHRINVAIADDRFGETECMFNAAADMDLVPSDGALPQGCSVHHTADTDFHSVTFRFAG